MKFTLEKPEKWAKELIINGPCQLRIEVDYDDVERAQVDAGVEKMLQILNTYWPEVDPKPPQAPEVREWLQTWPVVEYLISCRDQVARTEDVADHFFCSTVAARAALDRLKKVSRVDEIRPNLWHLE